MALDDTIAAISTPPGEGGIGIARLSGQKAFSIAEKIFRSPNKTRISKAASHTVHYGFIRNGTKTIDEVLLTLMKSPRTYTRENVVEINCHGGMVALKQVLDLLISKGARLAEPGEFTRRAFLNGRIDLSQAEAVADLIYAKTTLAGETAISHLQGVLRAEVELLSDNISDLLAEVDGCIDFPEEDMPDVDRKGLKRVLEKLEEKVEKLIETADLGIIIREGLKATITGRPNVGKSSLFNALIGTDRAIVTPAAGTTRDVVEASVNIGGISVILADTAGLAESPGGEAEKEAVKRSLQWSQNADVSLLVIDSSKALRKKDAELLNSLGDRKAIIALNKSDLPLKISVETINRLSPRAKQVRTSAKEGTGIENLKREIAKAGWGGNAKSPEGIIVTNARHLESLKKTGRLLGEAAVSSKDMSEEVISLNLKAALNALEEITGKLADECILSRIFSRFCIGK